jgi:hypothetical protein
MVNINIYIYLGIIMDNHRLSNIYMNSYPGVTLRLVFFPLGTALTSDGQCAVAVLCEVGDGNGKVLGISWGYGDIKSIKDGKNMINITS